jgi:hypothetical protein
MTTFGKTKALQFRFGTNGAPLSISFHFNFSTCLRFCDGKAASTLVPAVIFA